MSDAEQGVEDFDLEAPAGADADVLEERAVRQQDVPFLEDTLAAALTTTGGIYISLPGMCRALGLDVKGQMQRIKRTRSLAKGLRLIQLSTPRRGLQHVNCLRVDKVALWLGGVQTTSVRLAFREKIEAYQDDLAPVATQVFLKWAGIPLAELMPTTDPLLVEIAQQLDHLADVATFLREHLAAVLAASGQMSGLAQRIEQAIGLLEALATRQQETEQQVAKIDARTQRLTPAHARAVQEFVDHMVRETKHLPAPLTYSIIYGRLKHRFRVGSYSEVSDELFEAVLVFLREELRKVTRGELPEQGHLF